LKHIIEARTRSTDIQVNEKLRIKIQIGSTRTKTAQIIDKTRIPEIASSMIHYDVDDDDPLPTALVAASYIAIVAIVIWIFVETIISVLEKLELLRDPRQERTLIH